MAAAALLTAAATAPPGTAAGDAGGDIVLRRDGSKATEVVTVREPAAGPDRSPGATRQWAPAQAWPLSWSRQRPPTPLAAGTQAGVLRSPPAGTELTCDD